MNNIFTVNDSIVSYQAPSGTTRNWYHEEYNNNENLLITIGDSWTWGDHLGAINWETIYDDPIRLKSIYGKKLSEQLSSDWVLIANPGCSNYWMLEKLKLFSTQIQSLKNKYKNIFIVVTLTEDLRECHYHNELQYVADYYSIIANALNLEDFLIKIEKKLFLEFKNQFDILGVKAKITRAFTDIWPANKQLLLDYLLDKTWCDVFQDEIKFDRYYQVVPFLGQMAIEPLNNIYISRLDGKQAEVFKNDFVDLEEKIRARWNFLGESKYNLKGSTYHPSINGHKIFADYLYRKLF